MRQPWNQTDGILHLQRQSATIQLILSHTYWTRCTWMRRMEAIRKEKKCVRVVSWGDHMISQSLARGGNNCSMCIRCSYGLFLLLYLKPLSMFVGLLTHCNITMKHVIVLFILGFAVTAWFRSRLKFSKRSKNTCATFLTLASLIMRIRFGSRCNTCNLTVKKIVFMLQIWCEHQNLQCKCN